MRCSLISMDYTYIHLLHKAPTIDCCQRTPWCSENMEILPSPGAASAEDDKRDLRQTSTSLDSSFHIQFFFLPLKNFSPAIETKRFQVCCNWSCCCRIATSSGRNKTVFPMWFSRKKECSAFWSGATLLLCRFCNSVTKINLFWGSVEGV